MLRSTHALHVPGVRRSIGASMPSVELRITD
jgi:hypothetical protein